MAKNKETADSLYVKTQIVNAKRFRDCRDILSVVLDDGKTYTLAEIEKKVSDFKNSAIIEIRNGGNK